MFKTELTNAEKLVYEAICKHGILTHKDLVNFLHVSPSTIKTHLANIYTKLLVHSKAELIFQHFTEDKAC